jgi:hypothetical protein
VNAVLRCALVTILISGTVLPAAARKKASRVRAARKTDVEAAARLQVFLDRANFSPGKIDGRYNDFTWKALDLYRESRGEPLQNPQPQINGKSKTAPDVTGLDLTSVEPVFVPYTVSETDLQSVGPLPSKVSAQSRLKFLPYDNAADAIAEKFHSDVRFLNELNPGKMKTIKPGDQLMVPNVEPFELASVKAIKPGSEVTSQAANDIEEQHAAQSENQKQNEGATISVVVKVDTKSICSRCTKAKSLSPRIRSRSAPRIPPRPLVSGRCVVSPSCQRFVMTKKCFNTAHAAGIFTCSRPGPEIVWV